MDPEPDRIVIAGGTVYDGLGGTPRTGDVFLHAGKIEAVVPSGSVPKAGWFTVSASGRAVCPGFIDVHAHSDLTLPAAPDAAGKISQGVTSEISGNCGLSFFPVTEKNRAHLARMASEYGIRLDWTTFPEYIRFVESRRPAVNFNFLCGHNTLRAAVSGYENVPFRPEDTDAMRSLLRSALAAGSPGLSTGLLYVPGRFASAEELRNVCGVLRDFDAVYATHLRSEGDRLIEAMEEAVSCAEQGAGRLQISHLKTAGRRNHGKISAVFKLAERARARGLRLTADRYPYVHSQTSLSVILPPPYEDMTDAAIQEALSSSEAECARVLRILKDREDWSDVLLSFTSLSEYRSLLGLSLAEAGRRTGMHPAAFALDVLRRDASRAQGAFRGLSQENMREILAKPWVCCGTDENARPFDESVGRSHPRGFGSFPRFLRLVADRFSFAEAVRRMTSLPASIFGLHGRGTLTPGAWADIVILDEAAFRDTADFRNPHSPAEGLDLVFVNGVPAYEPGSNIRRAGRFLGGR